MKLKDRFGREHNYLRISLTDKCNYNCIYCNPNSKLAFKQKREILTFEEILRTIDFFASKLEFKKFRFTGGEPLVRKGIFDFFEEVGKLKSKYGFSTGLTTNGSLLEGKVKYLKYVGLDNLNISLDSLNSFNFKRITKYDERDKLLRVIDESIDVGFSTVKINMVVIKGINDKEILPFVKYFKDKNVNLRFIEFMPFGSNIWERNGFINYKKIKEIIEQKYTLNSIPHSLNAVAKDFQLKNYPSKISFISSISEHFCNSCNRVRISSKGNFRLCLFNEGKHGINFKELYRDNYTDQEILNMLKDAMMEKWEKHPAPEELVKLAENNMMTIGG